MAVQMSGDQLRDLIAQVMSGLRGTAGGGGGGDAQAAGNVGGGTFRFGQGGSGKKREIEERHYRRIKVFDGNINTWTDWAFQFKVCTRAASLDAFKAMEFVEQQTDEVWTGEAETHFIEVDIEKLDGELYDQLCSMTSGEPLTLIRGSN